ncbi:hypothetical protein, partial [Azotobacter beijerinckii]
QFDRAESALAFFNGLLSMAKNYTIELIKHAQQLAITHGEPHIVVQVASGQIIVMRDGKLRGAKLLERCLP